MDDDRPTAVPLKNFIAGLDSLRFCAALSVAVSHIASNLPVRPTGLIPSLLWRAASLLANGPAAVALFFVISGFCIHFGQAQSLKVDAPVFLARRGLRIGLPLIAVSLLSQFLGGWAAPALKTVLWSVYCELAYYFVYPAFLACRRLISMRLLLAASAVASLLTVTALGGVTFIWQYGAATAVVCFPLWVAGAWLAERHSSAAPKPFGSILGWRGAALLICVAASFTQRLGASVNAPFLVFAAAGTFCWHYLPRELAQWRRTPPSAIVEQLGRGSYSLYLVHILPIALTIQLATTWSFAPVVLAQAVSIALIAFCFFILCEQPSHLLARRIGRNRRVAHGSPALVAASDEKPLHQQVPALNQADSMAATLAPVVQS